MSEFDGGFLHTQRTSFGNDRGQTQVPRSQESNTIRSVTIAQLNKATSDGELSTDVLQIDGIEVSHLILCGVIQSMEKRASNMMYTIDDGTGTCTVKHFKAANDELTQYQTEDEDLAEGVWCMVYGHCRSWDQDYFVNVFRIRPITDHNEHLYFTKGPLPKEVDSKTTTNTEGGPQQTSQQSGVGDNSERGIATRVGEILQHCKEGDVSFDERLHGDVNPILVQRELNTLVQEGRACTTTHDDRYKWSS